MLAQHLPRALLVAAVVVLATASAAASATSARATTPSLAAVRSWAFAIGDGDLAGDVTSRYAPFDLVVVDGEQATTAQVAALRSRGKIVLAYLDVGTIEPGRGWFAAAARYRLDFWRDWGEWYANVDAAGYRALLAGRVAGGILAKGFDGLFLDNVDMIETHPRQAKGMLSLARELATLVHRRRRYLFAQNGEDVIGPMLPFLDGWNREDVTSTYDFSAKRYVAVPPSDSAVATAALRRMHARGLLTLATDYVPSGETAATRRAVATVCATGAVPFVSDIDLTRIPRKALRC